MHQYLITYSEYQDITLSQLWQDKLNLLQHNKPTENIKPRTQSNNIHGHRHTETDFHYKFHTIQPKIKLYYYQGNIKLLNQEILAIVGPRNMTPYAQKILDNLFEQAQKYKLVTISWLAPGVDQYAHKRSLQHNIPTIAVLWWGIKRFYEHKNHSLLQQIIQHQGLIISEFKLNFQPTKYSFPQRNRIIAWLATAVFLPQAWKKSWSLITADFAIKMKKPIYGSPNSIFSSQHQGLHEYMEQNKIAISYDHKHFLQKHFTKQNVSFTKQKPKVSTTTLTKEEKELVKLFYQKNTLNYQELIQLTKKSISQLNNIISILEIKGIIYQQSPGIFSKK